MGRLEQAKTLGGVGSILELIPIVSIVGYILTLIAVKNISDELQDRSIFNNMIYAVITGIIGVVVGAVLLFGVLLTSVFTAGVSSLPGLAAPAGIMALTAIFSFLAVVWVFLVISSIFIRRAFNAIAAKLNVGSFHTAGTLYFVGALLTIVIVGVVILFIAYIFQIVAFFSITEIPQAGGAAPAAQVPPASSVTSMRPSAGKKFCTTCGAELEASAAFCPKCGQKQPA